MQYLEICSLVDQLRHQVESFILTWYQNSKKIILDLELVRQQYYTAANSSNMDQDQFTIYQEKETTKKKNKRKKTTVDNKVLLMLLQIKNEPYTTHLISLWCPSMYQNANIPGTSYDLRCITLIGRLLMSRPSGSTLFIEFLLRFSVVIRRDWDKSNSIHTPISTIRELGNIASNYTVQFTITNI